ncbi:hypothetical protein [Nonomuraea rubra]|uniref:hypothetical protein n=1 Tax=Nonomuraea rubra TaxID=46180 RepID=UPI00340D4323
MSRTTPPPARRPMTHDELRERTPLGHSLSSHRVFGWCSHCADHTPAEELVAWRVWAQNLLLTVPLENLGLQVLEDSPTGGRDA